MRRFFFLPIIGILFVAIGGFVVMTLWNMVIVTVFSVAPINFWQAFGILVLSRILFGGFGCGWRGKRPFEMRRRWMNMSEEERAHWQTEWRSHCGWSSPPPPKSTDQP